ncbi:polymer-forming cytoskeletal protein [Colwellia sp. C1TZA3]|uniref:bactofilin family protein n=1 Tax=Colwellia sp. C1TZA3 TaxID=2508879 RepID=UPI0011B98A99|nr:polymer-forming cytoskeletal protein [Colwellia sp. C1TZA3]TWX65753.1 polymer-forming cytoskeletal protein [Colwellia sp. C1TZA3]
MFSKNKDKDLAAENKLGKTSKSTNKIPSIISPDVNIVGNVSSEGVIQLDGRIEGEINVRHLTVGIHGLVEGAICAEEAIVKGRVTGSIQAHKVILEKTAEVRGNIQHEVISIEAGAVIEGKINHMSENLTELAMAKKSSKSITEKSSEKLSTEKLNIEKLSTEKMVQEK